MSARARHADIINRKIYFEALHCARRIGPNYCYHSAGVNWNSQLARQEERRAEPCKKRELMHGWINDPVTVCFHCVARKYSALLFRIIGAQSWALCVIIVRAIRRRMMRLMALFLTTRTTDRQHSIKPRSAPFLFALLECSRHRAVGCNYFIILRITSWAITQLLYMRTQENSLTPHT